MIHECALWNADVKDDINLVEINLIFPNGAKFSLQFSWTFLHKKYLYS